MGARRRLKRRFVRAPTNVYLFLQRARRAERAAADAHARGVAPPDDEAKVDDYRDVQHGRTRDASAKYHLNRRRCRILPFPRRVREDRVDARGRRTRRRIDLCGSVERRRDARYRLSSRSVGLGRSDRTRRRVGRRRIRRGPKCGWEGTPTASSRRGRTHRPWPSSMGT